MRLIDLSNEIYDGQKSHFRVSVHDYLTHGETAPRVVAPAQGYGSKVLMMCDHTSTHVDAPAHFYEDGKTIERMPLDAFWGEGIAVDLSGRPGEGGALGVDDFKAALQGQGHSLRSGDVLLLKLMKDGRDVFSGLSHELARYVVDRGVKVLGVDRGTPDCPFLKDKPAHVHLLGAEIPIVEGLRNLERLVGLRFTFLGLPLMIRGATGSPIRAVALLQDEGP